MMKRLSLLLVICLFCTLAANADSIKAQGFWTRYSKTPRYISVDSTMAAKQQARAQRPVQFLYDVDFTTYFDNRE